MAQKAASPGVSDHPPEHLLRLARDKSACGREELSKAVSDLFVGDPDSLRDKERALMQAILHQLSHDAESSVRRLMSEKLADISTAPHDLIKTLANDEIEVAVPVLEKSTVLQDVDLIEVIRNHRLARLERATGNVDPREISILDVHRLVDATEAFERGELSGEELAEAHAEVSRKRTGPFARDMLALARKRSAPNGHD